MKPDIKGLTKLAQRLRRVPKKQFDMEYWWKKSPCGTAGCIAGWAATMFPSRFKKTDGYDIYNERTHSYDKGYDIEHRSSGTTGEEAFATGFRISQDQANELTLENMDKKRTPEKAAEAVMVLVGKLKKQLKG